MNRLTIGVPGFFIALWVPVQGGAAESSLWQGSFKTEAGWGAMELLVTRDRSKDQARLVLAPDARPQKPEVVDLRSTDRTIAFVATIDSTLYRFEGTRRDERWEGKLVVADSGKERGIWSLSRLKLDDSSFPLPAPTGRYQTGRVAFQWIDHQRPELETRALEDFRELLVYLFYPARPTTRVSRAPYMPDADVMSPFWKEDLTNRLKSLPAFSGENAPLLAGRTRFPVVIFAPGGGQKALAYTALLEDLASHGYVVAAIEPPYNAPAMRFPDGTTIGRLAPAERGWEEPKTRDDQPRVYEQMVLHWARDMAFVLDKLTELNNEPQGRFAHRLDVARVGAFGHSRGGQAAGTVRLLDTRFRGGVNLDGNIRGRGFQPITGSDGGLQPFMWIEKHTPVLNDTELERAQLPRALYQEFFAETGRLMQSVRGGSAHVTIARLGIEHLDFSDIPFWSTTTSPEVLAGKRRTIAVTRTYVRAFFDGCLKGEWGAFRRLTAAPAKAYPEVSSRAFGPMAARSPAPTR